MKTTFPIYDGRVPWLTAEQMIEVDRAMVEDYGIELIQMMENAGRNLAHLARQRFLDADPRGKRVVILAGTGGNGGGALVCARHLHNWAASASVYLTQPDERLKGVPAHQLAIVSQMGLAVRQAGDVEVEPAPDLVVDGVIGYSLRGAPHGTAAELVRWANRQKAPILALDAPSGVDTTTGAVFDPAVRATATMTLALPKQGLRATGVEEHVGELYLADIGVPPELYAEAGLDLHVGTIFAKREVVRLR